MRRWRGGCVGVQGWQRGGRDPSAGRKIVVQGWESPEKGEHGNVTIVAGLTEDGSAPREPGISVDATWGCVTRAAGCHRVHTHDVTTGSAHAGPTREEGASPKWL
jgi:hypothetical protein